jgi:hypothetical protein
VQNYPENFLTWHSKKTDYIAFRFKTTKQNSNYGESEGTLQATARMAHRPSFSGEPAKTLSQTLTLCRQRASALQ